jgi:GAF domain-containing protein
MLRDGDQLRVVAIVEEQHHPLRVGELRPLTPRMQAGRALLDRRTIHIEDRSDPAVLIDFPDQRDRRAFASICVPLLSGSEAIGVLQLARDRTTGYSREQIALLETFADQAAIAIENARLFQEVNDSNASLREALEQQTATSEILRVIASSPTNAQPVLDGVVESAKRLSGSTNAWLSIREGDYLRPGHKS